MKNNKLSFNQSGFTLLELLVVISIIGLITTAGMVAFTVARASSRDALRAGNVSVYSKALAMYQNDNGTFPISAGECLSPASVVGTALLSSKVIADLSVDPSWATTIPSSIVNGRAVPNSSNFCYYYYSDRLTYSISYYLETNSKAGAAGIHVMTQAGIQ